jgi:hypothetical protein
MQITGSGELSWETRNAILGAANVIQRQELAGHCAREL